MAEKDRDEAAPRQGYIPRPPTPEDINQVSRQQGMITDEWTGPAPAAPPPEEGPERDTEGQPS